MRHKYWIAKGRDAASDSGEFVIVLKCPGNLDKIAVKGLAQSLMRDKNRDDLADYFGMSFDDCVFEAKSYLLNESTVLYADVQSADDDSISPQGETHEEEPQGAQSALQGGHSEAIQHSRSPLRWDDEAIQQSTQAFNNLPPPITHSDFCFPAREVKVVQACKECGGSGLDHPCSAKSRNTDDDTCPRCKGTKVEPTTPESRPANLSDADLEFGDH